MIEIKLNSNTTDKKIFINGMYDYKSIPADKMSILINSLEKQFVEYEKNKKENK